MKRLERIRSHRSIGRLKNHNFRLLPDKNSNLAPDVPSPTQIQSHCHVIKHCSMHWQKLSQWLIRVSMLFESQVSLCAEIPEAWLCEQWARKIQKIGREKVWPKGRFFWVEGGGRLKSVTTLWRSISRIEDKSRMRLSLRTRNVQRNSSNQIQHKNPRNDEVMKFSLSPTKKRPPKWEKEAQTLRISDKSNLYWSSISHSFVSLIIWIIAFSFTRPNGWGVNTCVSDRSGNNISLIATFSIWFQPQSPYFDHAQQVTVEQ